MKILLAVQGTGNGHISRARDIISLLQNFGELDLAISGTQADVNLEEEIKYRFYGFSFIFGINGGVDRWATFKKAKLGQLWKDINSVPVENYDLIVNDFEPVTAWACKFKKLPCIALSHQSAFLSSKSPRPQNKWNWAEWVLKYYAPSTAAVAFHFERYDDFIYTPVIRKEIRDLKISNLGHYTVYLPAFGDKILLDILGNIPGINWIVFSKHTKQEYRSGNIHFRIVQNHEFNLSLASCSGFLTGGGFEGPAEALFLGKKLFSIPMSGQWEQLCNAAALEKLGVRVFWDHPKKLKGKIKEWVELDQPLKVNFEDQTRIIIENLVKKYAKNG